MLVLRPMQDDEFDAWFEDAIENSALETSTIFAVDLDQARQIARKRLGHLLADKLHTKDHYLYVAERVDGTTSTQIGHLWFSINQEERFGWLDDIELLEEFRGQGLGGQLLDLVKEELSKRGIRSLSLHVAANNERALKLYQKNGFKFTGHYMKQDW
jgi:ribosomal protein S18 acetylase RimI-like enzyme